jgi:hypothetical protein
MTAHEIVEVGHFECGVIEPSGPDTDEEQRVMVDESLALIAPQEGAEREVFVEPDLMRRHQAGCR